MTTSPSIELYPGVEQEIKPKFIHSTGEKLVDKTDKGKKRNWQELKQTLEKLVEVYNYLGWESKQIRSSLCGKKLIFSECKKNPQNHPKKLSDARFCRDRMCPTCGWRRQMRQYQVAVKVGHELRAREAKEAREKAVSLEQVKSHFLFLTLTIPNISLNELSSNLDRMFEGWSRLTKRKEFKKAIIGYHRALEISYNAERNDFHPHFHVALVVKPDYFQSMRRSRTIQKRNKKGKLVKHKYSNVDKGIKKGNSIMVDNPDYLYISQAEWLEMWRDCMRMPEITQVDIRKIRPKPDSDEIQTGFAEACKYSLKYWSSSLSKDDKRAIKKQIRENEGIDFGMPGHIWLRKTLEETANIVKQLENALYGRRLVQFGGLLRDIKRELKLKDAEEGGDLVNTKDEQTECNCDVCGAETVKHLYRWFSDVRDYIG